MTPDAYEEGTRRLEAMSLDLAQARTSMLLLRLKLTAWELRSLREQVEAEEKYNPNQPRVPAGHPDGGQWTRGDFGAPNATGAIQTEVSNAQSARPSEASRTDTAPGPEGGNPAFSTGVDGTDDIDLGDPEQARRLIDYVAYRGTFHDWVRDRLVDELNQTGHTAVAEVLMILPGQVPAGARLDILVKEDFTGEIFGIEVKTGEDPTYTNLQTVVYPHLIQGGSVFSPYFKIVKLGLTPLTPLPPIPIYQWYRRNFWDLPIARRLPRGPLDPRVRP